jgi:hypothetical protein
MLRILVGYGSTILEDDDCAKIAVRLHGLRFPMSKPRKSILTAAHVVAIRRVAHAMGLESIALAQALQFEATMRQKDIIGEWVPASEPGRQYLVAGDLVWGRGLLFEEINTDLILRHVTSKRQKEVTVDLKLAPMVIEELQHRFVLMSELPQRGPVIVSEETGLPYHAHKFRMIWREVARKAGVPDDVRNMDTRAGAITEALQAGASLDSVRKAATHSDISMTQRYSRDDDVDTGNVMRLRADARRAV